MQVPTILSWRVLHKTDQPLPQYEERGPVHKMWTLGELHNEYYYALGLQQEADLHSVSGGVHPTHDWTLFNNRWRCLPPISIRLGVLRYSIYHRPTLNLRDHKIQPKEDH